MAQDKRHERMLEEILKLPGNDTCADCHATAPRWASVNLGIFLCVGCASVHRKLGTHKSRVKSVTLDTWSREQINQVRSIGNKASNAIYNPNEALHPPPTSTGAEDRDSEIEKYIRRKYELGAFKAGSSSSRKLSNGSAPAPTSLNRARERDGRLPPGSVTNESRGGRISPLPQSKVNPRNPELNDILVQRDAKEARERDLPALPSATGSAAPRPRPQRTPSGKIANPFGVANGGTPTRSTQPAEAPLIDFGGGPSSTMPLQMSNGYGQQQQQQQQHPQIQFQASSLPSTSSAHSSFSSLQGTPFHQQNMVSPGSSYFPNTNSNGMMIPGQATTPTGMGMNPNNPFYQSNYGSAPSFQQFQASSPSPFHQSSPGHGLSPMGQMPHSNSFPNQYGQMNAMAGNGMWNAQQQNGNGNMQNGFQGQFAVGGNQWNNPMMAGMGTSNGFTNGMMR